MNKRLITSALLTTLFATISRADAATQAVIFDGQVNAACTLTVNSNGTMTVDTTLQSLSSHNGGGGAGSVTLNTTGGVSLSVDPVTVVTVPSADTSTTVWTPTYLASGAHTVSETGTSTPLAGPGTSTVSVHLAGAKSGTNRFAAGNYQATVTVRCE